MTGRVLACLTAVLLFAGCIGSDGLETDPAPTDGPETPTPTALTGSINGQVRRDNLDPLPGAIVALNDGRSQVAQTESDADGKFTLNEVTPGAYRLFIAASCCRDEVREVVVKEGIVSTVNVMLSFIPTERAYVERHEWNGFIGCAVHVWAVGGNNELCDAIDPNTDRIHQFTVREGIRSVVIGIVWEAELTTISFLENESAMRFRMYHGDDWVQKAYVLLDGGPPLQAVVQPYNGQNEWAFLNLTGEHTLSFQVWASGGWGGVTYQQPFTVYYDVYYWERAPDDATALPEI